MPQTADTRNRLVRVATGLFWFEGYGESSLAKVCERADANPGSLYYFFPTKAELLEAVLDGLAESIEENLLGPAWEGIDDPVERIFALLDAYRRNLIATGLTYGCPIGSLALELRDPPAGVRERLVLNFDGWIAAVRKCLEEARGRFPAETDLHALATFVLTTMEGGVMLARTYREIRPFDESVVSLRRYFDLLQAGA